MGEQRKIVILHAILCVQQMLPFAAVRYEAGIEVGILPPRHVVAIEPICFYTKNRGLVRVVSQALRRQRGFVEELPSAVLRSHTQGAPQQPDAVAVVDATAVFVEVSTMVRKRYPVSKLSVIL